jgi:hypothetical protein
MPNQSIALVTKLTAKRASFVSIRHSSGALTKCIPEETAGEPGGSEAGLVGNQGCSLRGSEEHADPAKLFETLGFSVSPPVNQLPPFCCDRKRDSSRFSSSPAFG